MSAKDQKLSQQELRILRLKGYRLQLKSLNTGAYAAVYKAKHSGQALAVKVIDCEKVSDDYKQRFLPRELYALHKLKHKFIISVEEIMTINDRVFVVMELAEGGDLIDLVTSTGPVPENKGKIYFRQMCEALKYMHSNGIAHRDLKCENILLNGNRTVAKLTDFGFARTCYENNTGKRMLSQTQCGTAGYVSPELIAGQPFDAIRSDCWSIGVVLYVILTKTFPFGSDNVKAINRRQKKNKYKLQNLELSDDCKDIISRLFEKDVNSRLSMEKALNHKWIQNIVV